MGTIFGGLPTGLSAIKWRGTFCVLAGLSALAFLCTVWTAPKNPKSKVPGGPDWIGTAIITTGLTLVLFCMSQGEPALLGRRFTSERHLCYSFQDLRWDGTPVI